MTYQGKRARPMPTEDGRLFEVSRVRIGSDGHVSNVLWHSVGGKSDRDVGASVLASAADVVDAIHDGAEVVAVFSSKVHLANRAFVIVIHEDGRECVTFDGAPSPGRNLTDLATLGA